jgi:hypothetical protein
MLVCYMYCQACTITLYPETPDMGFVGAYDIYMDLL